MYSPGCAPTAVGAGVVAPDCRDARPCHAFTALPGGHTLVFRSFHGEHCATIVGVAHSFLYRVYCLSSWRIAACTVVTDTWGATDAASPFRIVARALGVPHYGDFPAAVGGIAALRPDQCDGRPVPVQFFRRPHPVTGLHPFCVERHFLGRHRPDAPVPPSLQGPFLRVAAGLCIRNDALSESPLCVWVTPVWKVLALDN